MPAETVGILVSKKELPDPPPGSLHLVVSHDCDVIHSSFETEPHVEVLAALLIEEADGNKEYGKNPRCLHFTFAGKAYEAKIFGRHIVSRTALVGNKPLGFVDKRTNKEIARWISKRYIRAAFPNAFEDRIKPSEKKIKKLLKPVSKMISSIFLLVEDTELPANDPYQISMIALMPTPIFDNPLLRAKVLESMMGLADVLNQTKGIEVDEPEVLSEKQFSVQEQNELKRWDYDNLSSRQDPEEPMVSD